MTGTAGLLTPGSTTDQSKSGGDTRFGRFFIPGRSTAPGIDLLRLVQGVEFWRPTPRSRRLKREMERRESL
jgi:hypothetical protein